MPDTGNGDEGGRVDTVRYRRSLILILLAMFLCPARVFASEPYYYEPEVSEVTGRLMLQVFFGPPGYGEDPGHDSKESALILVLDNAIDVIDDRDDEVNETQRNVRAVQLVTTEGIDTKALLNEHVRVTGTLFCGHTGHHRTRVLIMVQKIAREKKRSLLPLKPYGPGVNDEQKFVWQNYIRMAAEEKDYRIVEKMLSLSAETDGVTSTQYALDLFDLYKSDPLFFVESVDKYYNGDFGRFLPVWINESGDITASKIVEYSGNAKDQESVRRFISEAEKLEHDLFEKM